MGSITIKWLTGVIKKFVNVCDFEFDYSVLNGCRVRTLTVWFESDIPDTTSEETFFLHDVLWVRYSSSFENREIFRRNLK